MCQNVLWIIQMKHYISSHWLNQQMHVGIKKHLLGTICYKKPCPDCVILLESMVILQIIPFVQLLHATRLFEAKVDEQLIMQRTGHTSTAVRSYKRVGEKLRAVTSDALNGKADVKVKMDQTKQQEKPLNENVLPGINIVGASNCTINIDYNH